VTLRAAVSSGEGVLGPHRLFCNPAQRQSSQVIGASTMPPPPRSCRRFNKYLLAERLPVATALRARAAGARSSDSAHNWAGFALFGRPDEVL